MYFLKWTKIFVICIEHEQMIWAIAKTFALDTFVSISSYIYLVNKEIKWVCSMTSNKSTSRKYIKIIAAIIFIWGSWKKESKKVVEVIILDRCLFSENAGFLYLHLICDWSMLCNKSMMTTTYLSCEKTFNMNVYISPTTTVVKP